MLVIAISFPEGMQHGSIANSILVAKPKIYFRY